MPTAIIGAVGIGAGLFSANEQRRAQEKAASKQEQAAIQNVQFLREQGQRAQQLIGESAQRATERASQIRAAAQDPLSQIATIGGQAFGQARRDILSGRQAAPSPLAQQIAQQSIGAVTARPGFNLTAPVRAELERQAGLTGQAVQAATQPSVLGLGRLGAAAAGDISGILQRQGARLGDIERQAAAQQASALVGQVPQIASQIQTGEEARILGAIPGQQFRTTAAEQLARLAGRVI